ncbi:cytochrome B oxidoreductase [Rubrivivax gelatinosus]|nr:cytochrome B oxidoreductase [Rubrivivax gelatinosus]
MPVPLPRIPDAQDPARRPVAVRPVRCRLRRPDLHPAQGQVDEGSRLPQEPRDPGLPDQDLQGHQGPVLRDLRHRQGRQEGRDLFRPGHRGRARVQVSAARTPAPAVPTTGPVVWDRFVRVFHWSLVACVLADFFVVDDGETLHQVLGYVAAGLVGARIVWGFVGSRHARFASFFPTPARLLRHLAELRRGHAEPHDGHNPLGALMMLALMALVLALGLTGWLQGTDRFWGEEWLQDLHEGLATALVALAGLHAAAAIVMGRIERTRLVRAMITGVKTRY